MSATAAVLAAFCAAHGGQVEARLPDGARVDCLTPSVAWEIEASRHWAEAVGQAAYYGVASGRAGGIVLVLDDSAGCRHLRRLWAALSVVSLEVRVETVGEACE